MVPVILCLDNCVKISTPINISRFEFELRAHPNKPFVNYLLAGLRFGFHTGLQQCPRITFESDNLRSARDHPEIVNRLIKDELDNDFLIGPFDTAPFPVYRVSPLGVVFGKYSGKPRLILDLSWPHVESEFSSINDLIDQNESSMSYATIDQAIQQILHVGRNAFLCKFDITSAFKLLPIRPALVPFYGCRWQNRFYFFVRLPFGGRSSPRIFDCLSQALEWILLHNYRIPYCQHLLDDFLTVASSEADGLRTKSIVTMVFKQMGIPLSPTKTAGPSTSLEYLGIVLDTGALEA